MDWENILERTLQWLSTSGLRVLLIIVLAFVAQRVTRLLSRRILAPLISQGLEDEAKKRADTLHSLIRYIFGAVILAVATMMVLGEFGIEIGPILAAAGIVGLAVGFGAQHLVQDVIAGFFILIDDSIRVGDVVDIAGSGGVVEKVNLRVTVLRDLAGNVHYVRNGQIGVVTNMTKEFSHYVFDIGVAYREDVDEVMAVVREVGDDLIADKEFADDILQPVEVLGLDKFADSAVVIKARIMTKPIKQWRVGREFNRRLKKKFDEKKIEIPFPHMTVYMGQDRQSQAPPLHVEVDQPERGQNT